MTAVCSSISPVGVVKHILTSPRPQPELPPVPPVDLGRVGLQQPPPVAAEQRITCRCWLSIVAGESSEFTRAT
jgi:hypothetical protein